MIKKKIDFIVKIGDKVLGGQKGASLSRSSETIDTTTKASDGWKESIASFKEWSVDSDGLLMESDEAYDALETAWEEGTPVEIEYAIEGGKKYSGKALITDFPVESPYDDTATYSVSFIGTGALTKTKTTA